MRWGCWLEECFETLVKRSPWGSIVLSLVSQNNYACCSCINKNVSEGIKWEFLDIKYFYRPPGQNMAKPGFWFMLKIN